MNIQEIEDYRVDGELLGGEALDVPQEGDRLALVPVEAGAHRGRFPPLTA